MRCHSSAEEVEEKHLKAFGPSLGPLYHALYNEVTWLHAKLLEYRKLYAKSEKRIDLLNSTAPFFFGIVHQVLRNDVLLHIARLTDPLELGRFENLTLLRLPKSVADPDLASKLDGLVKHALDRCQFARDWRNKRGAHLDLSVVMNAKAAQLPGVSRKQVEEALASFRKILNLLHSSYLNGEIAFERFISRDDADTLVYHLLVAARCEERQRERRREAELLPEDLEPLPDV